MESGGVIKMCSTFILSTFSIISEIRDKKAIINAYCLLEINKWSSLSWFNKYKVILQLHKLFEAKRKLKIG